MRKKKGEEIESRAWCFLMYDKKIITNLYLPCQLSGSGFWVRDKAKWRIYKMSVYCYRLDNASVVKTFSNNGAQNVTFISLIPKRMLSLTSNILDQLVLGHNSRVWGHNIWRKNSQLAKVVKASFILGFQRSVIKQSRLIVNLLVHYWHFCKATHCSYHSQILPTLKWRVPLLTFPFGTSQIRSLVSFLSHNQSTIVNKF